MCAFRIEQPQAGAIAAQAGAAVGSNEAAQDRAKFQQAVELNRIQHADQMASQLRTLDAQREMDIFQQQFSLQSAQRAQAWELEKMEARSRLDEMESEKERIKKKQEYNAGVDAVDKNASLPDDVKEDVKLQMFLKYYDVAPRDAFPEQYRAPQRELSLSAYAAQLASLLPGVPTSAGLPRLMQEAQRRGVLDRVPMPTAARGLAGGTAEQAGGVQPSTASQGASMGTSRLPAQIAAMPEVKAALAAGISEEEILNSDAIKALMEQ